MSRSIKLNDFVDASGVWDKNKKATLEDVTEWKTNALGLPQTFATSGTVPLSTPCGSIIVVAFYIGEIGSSYRRIIFLDKATINNATFYPFVGKANDDYPCLWFRPIEITNNALSWQAKENISILLVKSVL